MGFENMKVRSPVFRKLQSGSEAINTIVSSYIQTFFAAVVFKPPGSRKVPVDHRIFEYLCMQEFSAETIGHFSILVLNKIIELAPSQIKWSQMVNDFLSGHTNSLINMTLVEFFHSDTLLIFKVFIPFRKEPHIAWIHP